MTKRKIGRLDSFTFLKPFMKAILVSFLLFGCSDNRNINALDNSEYFPVDPREISCVFLDFNYEGVVAGGGQVEPIGGNIGSFRCALGSIESGSKEVVLASPQFANGGVSTTDFGVIQVRFQSSLIGAEYHTLLMTNRQKAALQVFLEN